MHFSQTISILKNFEKENLQGKVAHKEIAPFRTRENNSLLESPKIAAVLVLLYPINNLTHFVLIERATYDGQHSGQISFPGGKQEKKDVNLIQTALREAWEETNIDSKKVSVVGSLSKIFIPPSNFEVTPILAKTDLRPDFVENKKEVVNILEVKLSDLIEPKTIKKTLIEFDNGKRLRTPFFSLNSKIVWGATAMILNELRHFFQDYKKEIN